MRLARGRGRGASAGRGRARSSRSSATRGRHRPAAGDGSTSVHGRRPREAAGRMSRHAAGAAIGLARRSASPLARARRSRSSPSGGAGRTGGACSTRSDSSTGAGSRSRSSSTSSRCSSRALAWQLTIDQALPEPHQPRFDPGLLGVLRRAARERGRCPGGSASSRAWRVLRRHLPRRPPGTSATLVGTVFAHRLFDLVPATILVIWVLLTAKVPHWAVVALVIVALVGVRALHGRAGSARERHHRPIVREGMGSVRRLARHGAAGAGRAASARCRSPARSCCSARLAHAAVRRLRRDAGVRHRRADARGRARPRADERRDDLPALARQRRAPPGGGRAAARASTASRTRSDSRTARAAGGRDGVRRRRSASSSSRARGSRSRCCGACRTRSESPRTRSRRCTS